jgi:ATP-dependent DNA helicase DinG
MSYLDMVFGPDGDLAQKLPGYVPRAGQRKMAELVDRSYRAIRWQKEDDVGEFERVVQQAPRENVRTEGAADPVLIEAGTGVGKSFAYLVPAIYHAALHRVRTVVVTANINMQEQLVKKDLPFLQQVLNYHFTYGLQKGIRNYLCDARHAGQMGKSPGAAAFKKRLEFIDDEEEKAFRRLMEWGATTRTGDRSELNEEPNEKLWDALSTSSDDCAGQACGYAKTCHALKARAMARTVDILVVNYDLFFLNQTSGGFLLPNHQAVIMDEGHEAAQIARNRIYGMNISFGTFTKLFGHIRKNVDDKVYAGWMDVVKEFFGRMEAARELQPTWLREPLPEPEELFEVLREAAQHYSKKILRLERDAEFDPAVRTEKVLTERRLARCTTLATEIREFVKLGAEDDAPLVNEDRKAIYYLEPKRSAGLPALRSSFVSMGHILEPIVRKHSTIITSATLTNSGSFDFTLREFGLKENYTTLEVETPFDWLQQAWLVIPAGMPNPAHDREAFNYQACNQIARAIMLAKGRTLVLTTSRDMMLRAYNHTKTLGLPYKLYCQGEAPNSKLAQWFRDDVDSVLFGTDSFWTGIDVPGESLSCLIIDKLPFPPMDDPVLSYLEWRDRDAFFNRYLIPLAQRKLRQGFGRLIRSLNDKGVVVILDPRLKTEGYGKLFLESLPRIGWTHTIENIPHALAWSARSLAKQA